MPRLRRLTGLAWIPVLLLIGPLSAAANFSIADLDDDALRARVDVLSRGAETLSGTMDADVVALARTLLVECTRFDASRTENRVHLVRRAGDGVPSRVEIPVDPSFLVRVRAWIVRREGQVERVARVGGSDDPVDTADPPIVTFENLRPGDAWGWTTVSEIPYGVEHHLEDLLTNHPVMRTRVHVKSGAEVIYWAEPLRATDYEIEHEIRERRDGQPSWVQIDALNLRARQNAIFAPPEYARAPQVRITRRGRFYGDLGILLLRNDWDQWAALDVGSPTRWLGDDFELRTLALDVATRGGTDAERVDLLFEWLEESIRLERTPVPGPLFEDGNEVQALDVFDVLRGLETRTGPTSMSGWRQPLEWESNDIAGNPDLGRSERDLRVRPMLDVIESGQANPLERAALFASLVRAVGVDVILGFVRDERLGPLDLEATGRWQFTDMVVAPVSLDFTIQRWYCPTREGLEPGRLDVGLYDNTVVFIDPEIDRQLDDLWKSAWKGGPRAPEKIIPRYLFALRRSRLTRMLRTPPEPPRETHRAYEVIRFAADGASARGRYEADARIDEPDEDHWSTRFPGVAVSEDASSALPVALGVRIDVPDRSFTWEVPGPTVFGNSVFDTWTGVERPPFFVHWPLEYRWSVELPKPPTWNGIEGFEPVEVDHEAMQYRAWVVVGGDTVVLERQLVLHAGSWDGDDLAAIDEAVRAILDFERGNVVLHASTESR